MIKKAVVVLLMLMVIPSAITVCAQNDLSDQYIREIYDAIETSVDNDVWSIIDEFGFTDLSSEDLFSGSFDKISLYFKNTLADKIDGLSKAFFSMLIIIIFSSIVKTYFSYNSSSGLSIISTSVLIMLLTVDISDALNGLLSSMKSGSLFMLAFIPIYTVVISLSGNISSALSYNAVTVMFAEGISLFINRFLVDLIGVYFAVSIAFSFNDSMNLNRFVSSVNKAVNTIIGFISGIFTAILSIRGMLSASVDSVSSKGVKFLLSSLIPVVGSSLSEGYSSILGSISLIKGSVAIVGIAVILVISGAPIIEGAAYSIMLSLLSYIAEMLNENEGASLLRAINVGLKTVVILSVFQVFVIIISTGLMLLIKGTV